MEPGVGVEPITFRSQGGCSTDELNPALGRGTGIEPATRWLEASRSTYLSYPRVWSGRVESNHLPLAPRASTLPMSYVPNCCG